jgi:hypothetical protein
VWDDDYHHFVIPAQAGIHTELATLDKHGFPPARERRGGALLLNFQSAGQYTVDTGAARADQFRKGGTQ